MRNRSTLIFRLLIAKAYFDKGYGLTNYFFKLVAVFGLTTSLVKETFMIILVYTCSCYILGRFWYKKKLVDMENEINNLFNPFQREVRKKLKINAKKF